MKGLFMEVTPPEDGGTKSCATMTAKHIWSCDTDNHVKATTYDDDGKATLVDNVDK
ncbi:hypothetical protein L195_g061842, partial [Trifolium pratense]